MHQRKHHVVWLRNDLRLTDNKALNTACDDPDATVTAVFTATLGQWQQHAMSLPQLTFIHDHLIQMSRQLQALGIPLICHLCDTYTEAARWLADYCMNNRVERLFFNRQYEINERRRDHLVAKLLQDSVEIIVFDDSLLLPPGSVLTQSGAMYKVYTPFRQAYLQKLSRENNCCLPRPDKRSFAQAFDPFPIPPFTPYNVVPNKAFPVGEQAALNRLRVFCRQKVQHYPIQRDIPSLDGTSCLSPYLTIGVLSPRQCLSRLQAECPNLFENTDPEAFSWLNELIWREFYRHLIVAYPSLCQHQPFMAWTDKIIWHDNPQALLAWQEGKTGYPIVDAAMRQLSETGWMHNRLRMITASFLVKDLLIDWRKGERYFMSQLLDGDLAANNGGWQWAASTGTDAVPYFRIFNPTLQGKKYDPTGAFVRHWLPELTAVPERYIHTPHEWATKQGQPLDYPLPIVDHGAARIRTLAAFEHAKKMAGNV